eukprot:SAG31_NODE_20_length_34168_cov_33.651296_9_plen_79_part_00
MAGATAAAAAAAVISLLPSLLALALILWGLCCSGRAVGPDWGDTDSDSDGTNSRDEAIPEEGTAHLLMLLPRQKRTGG